VDGQFGEKDMSNTMIKSYFDRLWPICRSITGDGLRHSFQILNELIPLELTEVPTGTKVHDWEIPKEWNIRNAYIQLPNGERIAQFNEHNLHVLNYSSPIDQDITYEELARHVYTLPEQPNAIPYVTSYYQEKWGFCMRHEEWLKCPKEGVYRVFIDSELKIGSLTYGQCLLKGETDEEVIFSSYLCHPSMANNELSGPLVMAALYQRIVSLPKRKYSYRFVLAPETIGVIAFLSEFGKQLQVKCKAGWVLTCCGDSGKIHFKESRRNNTLTDRISKHVLSQIQVPHTILPFSVGGSDERQYCSPGYNLPIGSFMRTPYQRYAQYHTSLDNEDFISFSAMEESAEILYQMVLGLELNQTYLNLEPFGEPQLGKRGLYPSSNMPNTDQRQVIHELMHFLNWADGEHDLLEIAEKKGVSLFQMALHAKKCEEQHLVKIV
jgi:aminopeptidase-like protein